MEEALDLSSDRLLDDDDVDIFVYQRSVKMAIRNSRNVLHYYPI